MKNSTKCLLGFCLSILLIAQTSAQQSGNALSYDTTSNPQFLTLPNGIVSGITSDFTIEAWVYWKGGTRPYQRIFDFGSGTGAYMYLTPADAFGNVSFGFRIPGFFERQVGGGTLTPNTWNHIAVTVDYSQVDGSGHGPMGSLFINGSRVGYNGLYNYDGVSTYTSYYASDLGVTTQDWLGRSQFSADPYFEGLIDELRISNIVRYPGNFTPQTTQFATDPNTVALYHFNEGTGQTTSDATGNFVTDAYLGATTSADLNDPTWITNSILPIKLIRFAAQKADKTINLSWRASTTGEQGQFVIERSSDANHFQSIGSVSISKTEGTFDYSFSDHSFNSDKNYYRLKIAEDNASPKYSFVVLVNTKVDYGIYPTLASDRIYVTIPKESTISIYNSGGILLKRMKLSSSQNVDVNTLAKGVYYLRFEDSNQSMRFSKM